MKTKNEILVNTVYSINKRKRYDERQIVARKEK